MKSGDDYNSKQITVANLLQDYNTAAQVDAKMGDNRHRSEDSRFWGFVPDDHIVGKPIFIWFSIKGINDGIKNWSIRWDRVFTTVDGPGARYSYFPYFIGFVILWQAYSYYRKKEKENGGMKAVITPAYLPNIYYLSWLIPHCLELLNSLSRHTGLNEQRTQQIFIYPGRLASAVVVKARRVTSGLHVHSKVDDIHQHLYMPLRLHGTTHETKAHIRFAVFHDKSRNDGVKRPLTRGIHVGVALIQ